MSSWTFSLIEEVVLELSCGCTDGEILRDRLGVGGWGWRFGLEEHAMGLREILWL